TDPSSSVGTAVGSSAVGSYLGERSLALASLDHTCRDHCPDFSATLTTTDFDRSSLRWLGISDLIAEPEGPAFISSTVSQRRLDGLSSWHKTHSRSYLH